MAEDTYLRTGAVLDKTSGVAVTQGPPSVINDGRDGHPDDRLRWRNLKVGLLFLIGLGLASWLGFYIGKNTGLLTQHRYLHLFVTDIKGLTEGNLVSVSGKKVGVVKTMEFTSIHDTNGVLLTLDIRDEFFGLISQDSKAIIKSLGVLGDKYVDISLGSAKGRIQDGGVIAFGTEPGIDDLTASAITTMRNVSELTDKINKGEGTLGRLITTNELNDKINTITGNLAVLTSTLTGGNGIAHDLLTDGVLAQEIKSTMHNMNMLSQKVNTDGSLGKMVVGEQLLTKLAALSDRTDTLIGSLSATSNALTSYGPNGKFYGNVNESIQSLHHTLGSLDSLLTDFKANPKKYINVSVF